MKLFRIISKWRKQKAAAFGRLCVETEELSRALMGDEAAAFGRLCVETEELSRALMGDEAAAFGRLCVETNPRLSVKDRLIAAAFGRLCVETRRRYIFCRSFLQPPSGGCVLKQPLCDKRATPLRAAAFGRLCVETIELPSATTHTACSRLRAAVC